MRIKSRASAFILTIFCLATLAACVSEEPLIQVVNNPVDFGQVKQGETAIARFQLQNTGTQALTIQWMEFSEQGLIAQVKPQIGVGSSVEVLVNWDTSKFMGDIEGQVLLGLNDSQRTEIVLTLSGVVIPADIPSEPEIPVKEEGKLGSE